MASFSTDSFWLAADSAIAVAASSTALGDSDLLKWLSHASSNFAFVSFISSSSPFSFAAKTMSAFFILLRVDLVGISVVFIELISSFFGSLGEEKPPNNLEKKPFFLFSLLSLIMFT